MGKIKAKRIIVKTSPCPSCGSIGSLRRIIWGLPSQAIDLKKLAVGGCCIPESPPEWACTECPWSDHRGYLIPKSESLN
jgi:hypothetical protein